jgi:NTP pyrophosphatase (non-canonical NTP hydrolase)
MNMDNRFDEIIEKIIEFRDAWDWKQSHDPKNLAEAISIEAGELLETFL